MAVHDDAHRIDTSGRVDQDGAVDASHGGEYLLVERLRVYLLSLGSRRLQLRSLAFCGPTSIVPCAPRMPFGGRPQDVGSASLISGEHRRATDLRWEGCSRGFWQRQPRVGLSKQRYLVVAELPARRDGR